MKKRSSRLKVVLDLAERRKKDAEKFLGEQLQRVENDKLQLAQLESYLSEYQQQYLDALAAGQTPFVLQNFQAFMNKISVAIEQHKRSMQTNKNQLEQVRRYWAQMNGKFKAVDSLVEKAKGEEMAAQDKALQKLLDERSQLNRPPLI